MRFTFAALFSALALSTTALAADAVPAPAATPAVVTTTEAAPATETSAAPAAATTDTDAVKAPVATATVDTDAVKAPVIEKADTSSGWNGLIFAVVGVVLVGGFLAYRTKQDAPSV